MKKNLIYMLLPLFLLLAGCSSHSSSEDPVPGFMAGGPDVAAFDDCPDAERSHLPAKSYIDAWCSYSTNEIAINWNASFVYLSGGINSVKKE